VEDLEDYCWKLVHADVFRPPSFSTLLLSVCFGMGDRVEWEIPARQKFPTWTGAKLAFTKSMENNLLSLGDIGSMAMYSK